MGCGCCMGAPARAGPEGAADGESNSASVADTPMQLNFPPLSLRAKLILLMVLLLAMTLGAELWVSLGTQAAIVETTQQEVKNLAQAIHIGVQELTAVSNSDRD